MNPITDFFVHDLTMVHVAWHKRIIVKYPRQCTLNFQETCPWSCCCVCLTSLILTLHLGHIFIVLSCVFINSFASSNIFKIHRVGAKLSWRKYYHSLFHGSASVCSTGIFSRRQNQKKKCTSSSNLRGIRVAREVQRKNIACISVFN